MSDGRPDDVSFGKRHSRGDGSKKADNGNVLHFENMELLLCRDKSSLYMGSVLILVWLNDCGESTGDFA